MTAPTAVALLSGGMDSIVAAAMVRDDGYELITLAIDYGQRHRAELHAARSLSEWLEAREHAVIVVAEGAEVDRHAQRAAVALRPSGEGDALTQYLVGEVLIVTGHGEQRQESIRRLCAACWICSRGRSC